MRHFLLMYGLDLNNKLIFFAILFSVYLIYFHVKLSSRKTPKNFIDPDHLISLLHIFSVERTKGIILTICWVYEK